MRLPVALLLLLSGCTVIADLDGQRCDTDADCADGRVCSANNYCLIEVEEPSGVECSSADPCDGSDLCVQGKCVSAEDARWGCVDDQPEAPNQTSEQVALRLRLQQRSGDEFTPLQSATVTACEFAACEDAVGPFTPDSSGTVDVTVSQGFTGFVKVSAPPLLDTLYQLQAPLNADESAALAVTVFAPDEITSLAAAAGETAAVAESAWVAFQLLDCTGTATSDITISSADNESATVAYLSDDGTPVADASASGSSGLAFAGGGTAGSAQFNLVRESTGTTLGAVSVATAPGSVTVVPYELGR